MRVLYRTRQFFKALFAYPDESLLSEAQALLSPQLYRSFQRLPRADQCHSLSVYALLKSQGERNEDLLQAALLHDVGKSLHPLSVFERVLVVLFDPLLKDLPARWLEGQPRGPRRAFIVAAQHPEWGAAIVAASGGSQTLVRLVRHHQQQDLSDKEPAFASLLTRLQQADSEN